MKKEGVDKDEEGERDVGKETGSFNELQKEKESEREMHKLWHDIETEQRKKDGVNDLE